jgi:arginyl-tRNA synthetase
MLVEEILDEGIDASTLTLPEAEALYARASSHFRTDQDFADRARRRVVALQSGDEETRHIWRQLINVSLAGFNEAYARLGVLLTDDDLAGESMYNDDLSEVVAELERTGITVIDDGALCVFVEGFAAPMIVRKSDGGFGYSATDLAAIRHRVRDLHANRIIYVVDARQSDHFDLVFAVARKAGFLPDDVITEHVAFGTVLGTDGKPFKTREGTAVTLNTLLDAAEEQAAPPVALAAIKYADLSNALNKDYVFDVGRMVQTTGNTGPYLQYAHARVTQVLRKATARGYGEQLKVLVLEEPAEQTLALLLTRFGDVVEDVGSTLQPHRLCNYLYELSGALAIFYEQCPVLQSSGAVRDSRLALCLATKRVLASGLTMLGIEPLERM